MTVSVCRFSSGHVATQRRWPGLPNGVPCPPPAGSADAVRPCLLSWAGLQAPGPKTVLCVPSKSIDAGLVAAAFNNGHALLTGLECNLNVEDSSRHCPRPRKSGRRRASIVRAKNRSRPCGQSFGSAARSRAVLLGGCRSRVVSAPAPLEARFETVARSTESLNAIPRTC